MTDHCHHRSPIQPVFLCHLHHGHHGPHQAFPGTGAHTWANDDDQEGK